jgi:hypothetical protein
MIKKTIIVTGAFVFLLYGCAGPKPRNQEALQLTTEKQMTDQAVKARQENYENHIDEHKNLVKQRILKKAKVIASTVTVDAEWHGLIRQKVGEVRLNLSLRELNGVGAAFDSYAVRIFCIHDYFLKTVQEERVGTFFFPEPVAVSPFQTIPVTIIGNGWTRKNINRMNRLISSEDVTLEVELKGEDDNGHKLGLKATAGTI